MRHGKLAFNALTLFVAALAASLLVAADLRPVVAADPNDQADVVDEPTCSLDPSVESDCGTPGEEPDARDDTSSFIDNSLDLNRRVVSLTDENFDSLTLIGPATWLIMFKTDSCALCKKTKPVFEELAIDNDIAIRNDRELEALRSGVYTAVEQDTPEAVAKKDSGEEERKEDGGEEETEFASWPVKESTDEDGAVPPGPVYIATVDAGWSGRDITKRFGVDATPTIILLRNDGKKSSDVEEESRSYYVYRSQRAVYPLRSFALGGFSSRKKEDMPPPLDDSERKPPGMWGRLYILFLSPGAKWVGGVVLKIVLTWFAFTFVLGLFMRVHNYAWGENADEDYDAKREEAIAKEKADGRMQFEATKGADERSEKRLQAVRERKLANRAKFAANKEARKKKAEQDDAAAGGEDDDDDEMVGAGFSVKKADAKETRREVNQKVAKSKKT